MACAGAGDTLWNTHTTVWFLQTIHGENINRMSTLLSGMFPLRIYACHERKWNMSRWAMQLVSPLWYGHFPSIWSFMGRFFIFFSTGRRGGGGGGGGGLGIWSRSTLRKKQPCSQGKDTPRPLLPPPPSLFLTVWFDWCRGCATSGSMRKGSSIQSQFILFKCKNQ